MNVLADTNWPDAAIALAIILSIGVILAVAVWGVFTTGRAAVRGDREKGYRRLAEELSAMQRETTSELQKANGALAELHAKIREVEKALQELDRVLKTVD